MGLLLKLPRRVKRMLLLRHELQFSRASSQKSSRSCTTREQLVIESKRKYNLNFESEHDVQSLVIALLNSAYVLNSLIPNVVLLFYKIFCSPITTKADRAGENDREDVLLGNI